MEKIIELLPYKKIENQQFNQEVAFIVVNKNFQGIEFQNDKTNCNISRGYFKKIKISNSETINFKEVSINFTGCYIEEINIENIATENITLNFFSSIIAGRIVSKNIKSIEINNCIIQGSIFLLNQNSIRISYTEENIFPKIWEDLFKRIGYVDKLEKYISKQQSYFMHDSKKINFHFNEIVKQKRGKYENSNQLIEEWQIGYYPTEEQKKLLSININIKYSDAIDDIDTRISNAYLNSLSLSGNSKGNISIENTKIENWYLHDFSTLNEISLYNVGPLIVPSISGKIEFHKSNLDKTWFDNVNFEDYSIVSFYRTKFVKAIFTSCKLPKNSTSFEKFKTLENVHYPDIKPDNYYKDQYEIYLQLKLSLANTGNYYEAQKLHAISHDALIKITSISCWDRAILRINSISNNHGQSIGRPLCYFFLFSGIFYLLYLFSLGRMCINTPIDYKLIGYYFSFIDLTHRSDFLVDKNEFNAWTLIIDFLNKIVVGFFIYQFISSFRKYGKK